MIESSALFVLESLDEHLNVLLIQVGDDNVRALYKPRAGESEKKEMEFKKLKLEIEQLQYEKKVLQ